MTGRGFLLARALGAGVFGGLGAGVVLAVASCTSTSTTVTYGGYNSDAAPVFSIVSPLDGTCVAPFDAGPPQIPITVDVGGTFYLRPPGLGCQYTYNCGYVQLYVDNRPNNISGTPIVVADLSYLNNPYGVHTFTAELVWDLNDGGGVDTFDAGINPAAPTSDSGTAYQPPNGLAVQSVTVTIAPSCPVAGAGAGDGGDGG